MDDGSIPPPPAGALADPGTDVPDVPPGTPGAPPWRRWAPRAAVAAVGFVCAGFLALAIRAFV